MALKPRSHVISYLIVVLENLCHDSVIRSSGNHKLKKGIARISDIVRCDQSTLGELVRGADVLAVPAVKAGHLLEGRILGWQPRHSDLIGSEGVLPE
jgi:hypothetical protein